MKRLLLGLFIVCCGLLTANSAAAVTDPMLPANNHFGIHISTEADLEDAATLVNSSGGDWGYVTVVIQDTDQNQDKWQAMFDRMRELHLIPIVRLATHAEHGVWVRPMEHQLGNWVGFLNGLNWVVQNRYVVLFNEPNQAKEWGGEINPEEYAKVAMSLAGHLKNASDDYFILPAGMDAAAPNEPTTMNSQDFLRRMHDAEPEFFARLDGWTSHAYPNPGFLGSPLDQGKMSIRGYQWELDYLEQFGLREDIPVFVTETGWIHREGVALNRNYLTPATVAQYFERAYTSVWTDEQIVAITPFILRYDQPPFDNFSWAKVEGDDFHQQYFEVQALPKPAGEPVQLEQADFEESFLPSSLLSGSDYMVKVTFKNTGQSIWEPEKYRLAVGGDVNPETLWVSQIEKTSPGSIVSIWIRFSTLAQPQAGQIRLQLMKQDQAFGPEVLHEFVTAKPVNIIAQLKLVFQLLLHPTIFSIARK